MEQNLRETELDELIENARLYMQRLDCMLDLVLLEGYNLTKKLTVSNLAKEIAYNIEVEMQNISLLITEEN